MNAPAASRGFVRPVSILRSDDGAPVIGIEDISLADGVLYLSAYDRRRRAAGGIFEVPVADLLNPRLSNVLVQPVPIAAPSPWPERPHGIEARLGDDGIARLAVISRPGPLDGAHEPPEILLFKKTAAFSAERRLKDSRLCNANEIILLSPDRLLVTNDRTGCSALGRIIANVFRPRCGSVLKVDGAGVQVVATGIGFANGVAADERYVYVAATRSRALHLFDRAALEAATVPLKPLRTVPLHGAPDNIIWGDDGRLYIAAHPNLLRFALFRLVPGVGAPSRILRYDPATGAVETVVDLDAAGVLPGATAAVQTADHLIIAGGFAFGLAVMRIDR